MRPSSPVLGTGVAGLVLLLYVATLAPTVTFWDAGEFIATSRILGIPHPPATPLYVMLAHVWGLALPVGEWAWRTNLLAAVCVAAGAGLWAVVIRESIVRLGDGLPEVTAGRLAAGGAAAAALLGASAFTVWQNANETEVYGVALLQIGLVAWAALRWRADRAAATGRERRWLLLALYLAGLAVGNHLLALLVGPAFVMFLATEVRQAPRADAAVRRREWAQVAVVAGVWALVIGGGLGSTTLLLVAAVLVAAAAGLAWRAGALGFAAVALVVGAIGVTTYAFAFLRAGQQPVINEADPSTWRALLAVIRREQYPVRTPLDDPTVFHGPGNPGRSLSIVWLQLLNYAQYFDWQWAKGVTAQVAGAPLRTAATLAMASLGLLGLRRQRQLDRPVYALCFWLWLVTGLGLVVYMNFKPGFSIGWDQYPSLADHEVRERDYFFVVSFLVWGMWAGIGLAELARRVAGRSPALAGATLALAVVPVALNWPAASRRHGADATLAADFSYNLLNTVPPYGILFTYGDNDTFPLWWAQEVAGIRRDVTVVCLALANTEWYTRQLRDLPTRDFDAASAPAVWTQGAPAERPTWPLHTLTDDDIRDVAGTVTRLPEAVTIDLGWFRHTFPAGTIFQPSDLVVLRILQQNAGRRPVVWSVTSGSAADRYRPHVVQQGLGYRLDPLAPDEVEAALAQDLPIGVDIPLTETLADSTYRYGRLRELGPGGLDPTSTSMASALSIPFTQLALLAEQRADRAEALRRMEQAAQVSADVGVRRALEALRAPLPAGSKPK